MSSNILFPLYIMLWFTVDVFFISSPRNEAQAQTTNPRDEEIFGGEVPPKTEAPAKVQQGPSSADSISFTDNMQVGGRLELRTNSSQKEQQPFSESTYSHLKRADIYFDSRLNKNLRSLLRIRLSEENSTAVSSKESSDAQLCESGCTKTELDEFWFKWDLANTAYFTLGKQHLKWGSGRFWNPTDFTAVSPRDPLAQFDSRVGQELLKIHIPIEKQGFNYYALLQFDDVQRNDDIGGALRGEFAIAGKAELALTLNTGRSRPVSGGIDLSGAVGPVDMYVEIAGRKGESRDFFEGTLAPDTGTLPTAKSRKEDLLTEAVTGIQYSLKYSADDSLTVGGEFFENGLGYRDRELEMYSLVLRQSKPLYAGRQYAGAYVRVPSPGSWNDTSFFLYGLQNLSDKTSLTRVTTTWKIYKDATIEAFVSHCFGDFGELCFRVPKKYQALAANPVLSPELKQTLLALPTKRSKASGGLAMSLSF